MFAHQASSPQIYFQEVESIFARSGSQNNGENPVPGACAGQGSENRDQFCLSSIKTEFFDETERGIAVADELQDLTK